MLRICDLFSGTGGFSVAFEKFDRYKSVIANDIEPSSKKVYEENCKGKFILKDINSFTNEEINLLPDFDILTGGFSCQPFSLAGKKLGFEDDRSDVFWKILDFLEIKKPSCFVLENVKNLKSHDNGNSFKRVLESLEEKGYHVKHNVLDTSKVSRVPHGRERIYLIGFLDKNKHDRFAFPQNRTRNCLPICDFLEEKVPEKYFYEKSKIYDKIKDDIVDDITETNTVYQYRRHYVRENKSELVPTLTANMGTGGHNVPLVKYKGRIRKLTPRECFSFQGFPVSYKISGLGLSDAKLYKLAGNAISVCVVEKIAEQLLLVL
jgi:DNA (cytosine-5)-methyltransferase 1